MTIFPSYRASNSTSLSFLKALNAVPLVTLLTTALIPTLLISVPSQASCDNDLCQEVTPFSNQPVGIDVIRKTTFADDNQCNELILTENNVYTQLLKMARFNETLSEKKLSLVEQTELRVQQIQHLTTLQTTLGQQQQQLDNAKQTLEQLDEDKDAAYSLYRTCRKSGTKKDCQDAYNHYRSLRLQVRDYQSDVIRPLENQISDLSSDIDQLHDRIEEIRVSISDLETFIAAAEQAENNLQSAWPAFVETFNLPGEWLTLNLHAPITEETLEGLPVTGLQLFFSTEKPSRLNVGRSLGIIGLSGQSSILEHGLSVKTPEQLWSVTTSPEDKNQEFLTLLQQDNAITVHTDRYLACDLKDKDDSHYLDSVSPSLLIQFSESMTLQNTYDLSIDVPQVVSALTTLTNEYGYLSHSQLTTLLQTPIPGFNLTTVQFIDATEQESLLQRLQSDFLLRLLSQVALPAPATETSDCQPDSDGCIWAGWWLDVENSPVLNGEILATLSASPTTTLTYLLSGEIYLTRYLKKALDPHLPND